MNKIAVRLVALVFAGFLMTSPASAILTIDSFDVGTTSITANSGTPVVSQTLGGLPAGDTIGGVRFSQVTWQSGALSASMNANPPAGVMGLSSNTGVTALFELGYDAGGAGLGGIDLTEGGLSPGFAVFFTSADAGSATTVTLEDTGGDTLTRTLNTPGPGFLFFQYAAFAGVGDVTDIDSIDFSIQGVVDGDYQVELIQSRDRPGDGIPEPITATLALVGLCALGVATRRRAA